MLLLLALPLGQLVLACRHSHCPEQTGWLLDWRIVGLLILVAIIFVVIKIQCSQGIVGFTAGVCNGSAFLPSFVFCAVLACCFGCFRSLRSLISRI